MTRYLFSIIITSFIVHSSLLANEGEWAVSKIPAPLLNNAHVVKRMENIRFEYISTNECILHKTYVLTILDQFGDEAARFGAVYDNFQQIKNIEGVLYDSEGREIKRLKNRQVIDMSASDDADLADDSRWKSHHFYCKTYPYSVQYEVEIKYNGSFNFPDWDPRNDEHMSVEQSSFTLVTPINYEARFKALNIIQSPTRLEDKNKRSLTWEVRDLPAIEDEFASPSWFEFNPVVLTGPTEFQLAKYRGDMANWEELGKFFYLLNVGRDELPQAVKGMVHAMVDSIQDRKRKIERLYDYLQHNTRYVSVQLGIGGWQPFDATYVATKAYGDCKALVNFMYALLKEAGIYSCYVLVRAGRGNTYFPEDFPSNNFNHVILCVPLSKDTLWLECTSQTLSAGYLSEFTSSRYGLAVTPEGGKLVHTPVYGKKENLSQRTVLATLDEEGNLSVKERAIYTGLESDGYHRLIHENSPEKTREVLEEQLDLSSYYLDSFNYKEDRNEIPVMHENLALSVNDYATISGKRIFIMPNILSRSKIQLKDDAARTLEVQISRAWVETDSVDISLPGIFTAESIPSTVAEHNKFGSYEMKVTLDGNRVRYSRKLEVNGGRYPASDYGELQKFFELVFKSDRSKVVLVK